MKIFLILGLTLIPILTDTQVVVDCYQCNPNFAC